MSMQLSAYQSPEHEPFSWLGGPQAALLIHGFPGTPAEMRPLGEVLHAAGWTVEGLLLPGFGKDFARLPECTYRDWLGAVRQAIQRLQGEYATVLLAGNSMGAALALLAAAAEPVDGVLLLAPFWRAPQRLLNLVFPVARYFFPRLKPFEKANFRDPEFRAGVLRFLPEADLDDPAVEAAVRQLTLPTRVLAEVRAAGQLAYRAAKRIRQPALIIQGIDDEVVPPGLTRQLARRLPNLVGLVEVSAAHDLSLLHEPVRTAIEPTIVAFVDGVLGITRAPAPAIPQS